MTIVTISAQYGCAGSQVGPAVAERLGLRFLDRAISSAVAEELHVSVEEAERGGPHRSWFERLAFTMSPFASEVVAATGGPVEPPLGEHDFRQAAEQVLHEATRDGAVVLGRAGAWALGGRPGVLRVRLYGDEERRVAQAQRVEGVDEQTARRRLGQVDAARAEYVRRLYGAEVDDAAAYDLQVDSTVLPLEVVVELVVIAATAVGAAVPPSAG
jgi:cytidylate kinase